MKNLIGKVKDGINKSPETLKSVYGDAVSKLNSGLSKIGNMGTEAKNKVLDFTNEIISLLPILEEFGYKTTELRVGVSIPPTIEIDVLKVKEISKEEHDEKLQLYKSRNMFNLILKALESALSIQDRLSIGDDYYHEFSLQISIPPNIGIKYRLKENLEKIALIEQNKVS
ncbi:MAG: hypothetical protein ABJF11_00400 [Reichenbachiella sp.]|uniref:hypothetical protein n=1 Tax=Reichenbachiella sp. TaxID=2184521 RepID=UPI0032652142